MAKREQERIWSFGTARLALVLIARCLPALVLAAGLLTAPTLALAQDGGDGQGSDERRDLRGDELRERIPAVTGHMFLKQYRHEISTVGNVSIADAFRRKYLGGLSYTYHVNEHFSLTGRAGYTLARTHSGAVQICSRPTVCVDPDDDTIDRLPGNVNLLAGVQAEFSPIYGKLNLIAERVLHFDTYVSGGLGLSHFTLLRGSEDLSGFSPALLLGVGQRYFVNQWIAVRLEMMDLIYVQPTGKRDRATQHEFLFTLGASFFFPTTFTYGR
jgi:outer membrane beta-barrel protein